MPTGERLRVLREAAGLEQGVVAKAADITQACLSRYENDKRPQGLTRDVALQIASVICRLQRESAEAFNKALKPFGLNETGDE